MGTSKHLLMLQLSPHLWMVYALALLQLNFCVVINGKRRHETKLFIGEEQGRITKMSMLELFRLSRLAEQETAKSLARLILK